MPVEFPLQKGFKTLLHLHLKRIENKKRIRIRIPSSECVHMIAPTHARTHTHKESIQSLAIIGTERFCHADMPINIGDHAYASTSNPCQAYISSGS